MSFPLDLVESPEDLSVVLEFHVMAFAVPESVSGILGHDLNATNKAIGDYLNAGWEIDDKIICPPIVWLIFSREKEIHEPS